MKLRLKISRKHFELFCTWVFCSCQTDECIGKTKLVKSGHYCEHDGSKSICQDYQLLHYNDNNLIPALVDYIQPLVEDPATC